jgi:hypothetical protein
MSGFTEHQASGASDLGRRNDAIMTWTQAQCMLPLVRRIVGDIVGHVERLLAIEPEKDRLDRHRHDLVWLERQRRYQLADEQTRLQNELHTAIAELDSLGIALLDPEAGMIGFPTLVNDQRAFFAWKLGDEGIDFWQFADGSRRRPVPAAWKESETVRK